MNFKKMYFYLGTLLIQLLDCNRIYNIAIYQGFPNTFAGSPPFQKFVKKSPFINLYNNFPLEGALFS